jgi:UDP-N-acetylglucosamine 2-epimerase (non-hydrolysing)
VWSRSRKNGTITEKENLVVKIAVVFGTRPEAIKMAPVVKEFQRRRHVPLVIVTAQHRDMLDQHMRDFGMTPDIDLDIMKEDQDLAHVSTEVVNKLHSVLQREKPDALLVQGDTTTTFASSLTAFYHQIPVGHVEAGLRTWQRYLPYPEEMNRQLTTRLAQWHFASTSWGRDNLLKENVSGENIFVTGNPVIDILLETLRSGIGKDEPSLRNIDFTHRRVIVLTAHRRENFGEPLEHICRACLRILDQVEDVEIVYPVHPNPNVQQKVRQLLGGRERIHLIAPLEYRPFVQLMNRSYLILSDSGGIQEEAPSLGKPVLVLRTVTERPEAIASGVVKLVGTDEERIIRETLLLLKEQSAYRAMTTTANPYGDGKAAVRIVDIIESQLQSRRV